MIGDMLRRFLAWRGYLVSHFEASVPERIETYLGRLASRSTAFEQICACDGDPETLNAFSKAFGPTGVHFHSEPGLPDLPAPAGDGNRLLLEADVTLLRFGPDGPISAWLNRAAVVIVRGKIGQFWAGRADLCDLAGLMEKRGFHLDDVLQQPSGPPAAAPGWNVYAAFNRGEASPPSAPPSRQSRLFRLSEAWTLLSAPIVSEPARRLTGRGSYGFAGGVFNPGAIHDGQSLLLLARGERTPWTVHRRSQASYLASGQSALLTLGPNLQIAARAEVRWADLSGYTGFRFEDFRLFEHQGCIYSNHSYIQVSGELSEEKQVHSERLRTSVGVSRFDVAGPLLTPFGPAQLDQPVGRTEKNWAMFSHRGRVHLIYSFSPYRLFTAQAFPDLRFALVAEKTLRFPLAEDGLRFRNSINPIPWDSHHLLHIVHKVYPEKRYIFWAVLLDNETLLPVQISRRPLVSDRSGAGSITYVCSAVCDQEDLLLFGGIDDSSIGAWRVRKTALEPHWRPIA